MTNDLLQDLKEGKYSLHDSSVTSISISYPERRLELSVCLVLEDNRSIKIILNGIKKGAGRLFFDPINSETILHFDLVTEYKIALYTSSDTELTVEFESISISWV